MDDDFDILSLLVEEKSKEQLVDDAIEKLALSGYKSKNKPELIYQIIPSEFKQWLINKCFMSDFLEDDIAVSDIDLWVKQASFSFVYYGDDF